jgi:hypothetical protein
LHTIQVDKMKKIIDFPSHWMFHSQKMYQFLYEYQNLQFH